MRTNVEEYYQRPVIQPLVTAIVGTALLFFALIVSSVAGSRWLAARTSRSWTGVEGVVIESRLYSNCNHCWPIINYRYVVNGQSFVGDHIVAGPQDYYNSGEAEIKVGLYSMGRKVIVYYDPSNPARSCLEAGVFRWSVYLFSIIGACLLGSALFLFWRLFRGRPICLARSGEPPPAVKGYSFVPRDGAS